MMQIVGALLQNEVGKGAFQELDQCSAAAPYTKLSIQVTNTLDIPKHLEKAFVCSMSHGCGPSYVDIPSNIFMSPIENSDAADKTLDSITKDLCVDSDGITETTCTSILAAMKAAHR